MLWWTLHQLKSGNDLKRKKAVENLGGSMDARAVEPLIATLTDTSSSVRKAGIQALEHIGDHRAIEPILASLSDSEGSVRKTAAQALNSFGWQPADDSQRAILAVAQEEWDVATIIGEQAIEPLMIALKDKGDIQSAAVSSLVKMGSATVKPLAALLKDKNVDTRKVAANALKQVGTPEAREALTEHRRREEEEQRRHLAEFVKQEMSKVQSRLRLEQISYKAASETLAEYTGYVPVPGGKNDNILTLEHIIFGLENAQSTLEQLNQTGELTPQVESEASSCALAQLLAPLSEKASEASLPALIKALEDGDERVRRDAAHILSPALIEAIQSDDTVVQVRAFAILNKMGAEARPSIPVLLEAMKSTNPIIHDLATKVLVELALPKSVSDQYMIEILDRLCCAYASNDLNQINSLESEATRVGSYLNSRGGISEMRRFFNLVSYEEGKRTLEMHWNGIGEWRG